MNMPKINVKPYTFEIKRTIISLDVIFLPAVLIISMNENTVRCFRLDNVKYRYW